MRFALTSVLLVTLAACATEPEPTPAQVILAPHGGGDVGVGESWVGNVQVTKGDVFYQGNFTFVSDAELSASSSAQSGGLFASGSQSVTSSTGQGKLILIGDNQDVIRCDLRYSMRGNGQAIGVCTDSAGLPYDITIR
ncbi:MAG: hypothetical protein AAFO74_12915 [Pseudomonadota bacterium]